MSVYVDTARNRFGRMVMCHMMADTPAELHAMAKTIGLKKSWYQSPQVSSFPHYDLSLSRRKMAIRCGAIVLERQDMAQVMRQVKSKLINGNKTWKSAGW